MKQPCYLAKICDGEFNKTHIRVNLFSLQLCLQEEMLKIECEKDTPFVSRTGGYFLKISGRYGEVLISNENP